LYLLKLVSQKRSEIRGPCSEGSQNLPFNVNQQIQASEQGGWVKCLVTEVQGRWFDASAEVSFSGLQFQQMP
jgi:hypothetical protein